jgi:hypothetical protein
MSESEQKQQSGSLRQVSRANGLWAWEWRYYDPETGEPRSKYLPGQEFPTRSTVEEHLRAFVERLNAPQDDSKPISVDPTVGDLLDKFIADEKLAKIKKRKPGERAKRDDELAFSTAVSYLSLCNKVRGAWGGTRLDRFKPLAFQNWLKDLPLKPKTKGHVKAFVNRLFNKAKLFEMLSFHENPISLVEVRGILEA